jgi:hypothetical protein
LSSKQVESLVKLRDALSMASESLNEYIDTLAPAEAKKTPAVDESLFLILKFEPQQGAKLGDYEVSYKANNIEEKWIQAFKLLETSKATIQNRYHGKDYQYTYWLYGENKIYRQKMKEKTT